jgi:hypothetical protein
MTVLSGMNIEGDLICSAHSYWFICINKLIYILDEN